MLFPAFDGIGGFFFAWGRLGLQVAVRCASEVNLASIRVSKAHWPSARHVEDISEMSHEDLKDILDKASRDKVIVLCGSLPSPELTGDIPSRKDVAFEGTKASVHLLDIVAWFG